MKQTKTKEEINKKGIVLLAFYGCLLAILLVGASYFAYDKIFNYETIETIQKIDVKGNTMMFVGNADVLCENGVHVSDYGFFNKQQTIYGCLEVKERRCAGDGKICIIKTTERVRK
jgi:hypothetical protein